MPLLGGTNKDVIELPMSRVEANFLNEGNNMKDKYLIFFFGERYVKRAKQQFNY